MRSGFPTISGPLLSHPKASDMVADQYLGDLATAHGGGLATLNQNISHKAIDVI